MQSIENIFSSKRIIKNILTLTGSQLISRACGLVLVIALARHLGPVNYGIYSLAFTFYMIFYFFSNLGMDTLLIKDVSRCKTSAKSYLPEMLTVKLISSGLSILLIGILVHLFNYSMVTKLGILTLSIAIVFSSFNDTLKATFNAYELMEYPSLIEVIRSFISLSLIFIFIWVGKGVLTILSIQVFSFLIALMITLLFMKIKLFSLKNLKPSLKNSKTLILNSLPFFSVAALFMLNTRIDIIMISWFKGETGVGIYNTAVELMNITFILPALISTAFFPVLSRCFREDVNKLVSISNFGLKLNITLSVPIAVGVFILAPKIVLLIFGTQYYGAVIILRIFSINILMQFGVSFLSWIFTATENVNIVLKANGLMLLLNVILNLFLIPSYGLAGAAIATVFCRLFGTTFLNYMRFKKYSSIIFFKFYLKPAIATTVMACFVYSFAQFPLAVLVFAGAVIYFLILVLVGGLNKDEMNTLKAVIHSFKIEQIYNYVLGSYGNDRKIL